VNRRNFLKSIPAAFAALKALTLPSVAEALTETPVTGILRRGTQTFEIVPTSAFEETHRNTLPCTTLERELDIANEYEDEDDVDDDWNYGRSTEAVSASGTQLSYDGVVIGDIAEIKAPELNRMSIDATSHHGSDAHYMTGLQRREPISFQISFEPGADLSRLIPEDK